MTIIGHIITALVLYANPQAVNHCWMIHSKSTGRLHVFIRLEYAWSTASCFRSTDYDEEHLAPLSDTLNDMCRAAISLADNDFPLHLVAKCANNEDAGRKKHLCWLTFPSLIRMHRWGGVLCTTPVVAAVPQYLGYYTVIFRFSLHI